MTDLPRVTIVFLVYNRREELRDSLQRMTAESDYPAELVDYRAAMQAGYGDEKVHYSENSLAFYYERNCKFALMSCAHYVALAAGRATDAFVSCLVADLALNDGALLAMADRMSNADAVLAHAIQMHGKVVRPLLEQRFRGADGILQLSPDSCARLVIEHIPRLEPV